MTLELPATSIAKQRPRASSAFLFSIYLVLHFALLPSLALGAGEDLEKANLIERILRSDPRLAPIAEDAANNRLQVLLGTIEDDARGNPSLRQHGFRVDAEYFYPASTIKLFAATAALETVADLRRQTGLDIDVNTAMRLAEAGGGELEQRDESNLEGAAITVQHEIRKLFLVSDNTAFNRLYTLVGRDDLNRIAWRSGAPSLRLRHRLSLGESIDASRHASSVEWLGQDFRHRREESRAKLDLDIPDLPRMQAGSAYLEGDRRIAEPLDFSLKNRVSLADLQHTLAGLLRPELKLPGDSRNTGRNKDQDADNRFQLASEHRAWFLEAMSQLPGESPNPLYDAASYPDHWVKFLLPGIARVVPAKEVKIYNKIGQAYGFSIENAYVVHEPTGRGFFLAAVLYTNANGVLNDDVYEYETIADPFFADLGEALARALW